jgi:hypothetical protein
MPTFDVEQEEITAFEFGQTYLFKQYFDRDDLFQQLQEHYNSDKYRFEVPEGAISEVRQILDSFFYELKIADEPMDYCVVQDKQVDSSDILRNSVANQRQGNYEIYLRRTIYQPGRQSRKALPDSKMQTSERRTYNGKSTDRSGTRGGGNGRYKYLPQGYPK